MDTNVDGVWNCAQAFGRVMVAQERVIVNIGSISGLIVNSLSSGQLLASKAAVRQLTRSLPRSGRRTVCPSTPSPWVHRTGPA